MKGNYYKWDKEFEKDVMSSVAQSLKDLMKLNEVDVFDVANGTRISRVYIEKLICENVCRLGLWELYQLSEYFNVSIDELLRRD